MIRDATISDGVARIDCFPLGPVAPEVTMGCYSSQIAGADGTRLLAPDRPVISHDRTRLVRRHKPGCHLHPDNFIAMQYSHPKSADRLIIDECHHSLAR
jgi:hypothetical protein